MTAKRRLSSHLIIIAVALSPTAALAESPRQFLKHAMEGDNSEIMLGHMAQDRGRSSGVRDFGQALVADHTHARNEVIEVGRQLGVRPSRDVAPEAREEREKLSHLQDRDFDREFVRYMVDDHHKDISDFTEEARERHGSASELAQRQLPTLRKHLDMAMAMNRDADDRPGNKDRRGNGNRGGGDR